MKGIKYLLSLSLCIFFISCSHLPMYNNKYEQLKVIRVIGATEVEVVYKKKVQIVSLAGIYFIDSESILSDYFETAKIENKYKKEVLSAAAEAENFLFSSVSSGDVLYVLKSTDSFDISKNKELVVYSPDLKSINEKMVENGFAFPKQFSDDPEISQKIRSSFNKSIKKKKGLWRVGQLIGGNMMENSETESIQEKKTEAEVKTEAETKPVEQEEKKETPEVVK